MTYFILQTLLWLLAAFIIGLILGRWIKRLLCKQPKTIAQSTTSSSTEHETPSEASYTNTADKLALRSTKDDTLSSQSTETVTKSDSSISAGTAALGATAVGIAGHVASQALSDDDAKDSNIVEDSNTVESSNEVKTEKVEIESKDTSTTDVDDITIGRVVDTVENEEVDVVNPDLPADTAPEIAELETDTISDVIEVEDEPSIAELLSKGTAAGAVAAGVAGLTTADGNKGEGEGETVIHEEDIIDQLDDDIEVPEPEISLEFGDTNEDSQPNSYLDSILAEGASVIAGVESSKLRMIDGIGKKMETILHDSDINTWKDLSMKSDTELRAVLDKYDDRYKGVELDGWVLQAALLADGKVDELISLQKENDNSSHLEDLLKDS